MFPSFYFCISDLIRKNKNPAKISTYSVLYFCHIECLKHKLAIIQAQIPFTNSTHELAKCACWDGSITHNTEQLISHSGLGIVAKVKLNQSQTSDGCAIATLITRDYALFVKGISAWIIGAFYSFKEKNV